ncbi:MAG: UDP-N-acetylmuramoyl-L-alanine--D-glutamate ligase [Acidobacteria bacterium]|nr:MAG: UDP-N-acetylmuramoyl-L-alanine--D-glutamate ligase [Acidobacteriota bacterium]
MTMTFSVMGRNTVVVGAGRSGVPAAKLLRARGARVTLADSAPAIDRETELRAAGVAVELGAHRADLLEHADLVVLSPGVDPEQPFIANARRRGVPVIGELELASRWIAGRLIAITGTKGKSTTTTLTARMLTEAGFDAPAGGNIGTALSGQVEASTPETLHVVETSSFQLEGTDAFHPWIAVLLNLSADHLDRHPTFDAYADAKARIFRNQTADDWAVVNLDDEGATSLARRAKARARRFDFALDAPVSDGVTVEGDTIVRRSKGAAAPLLPVAAVKVPGRHILSDVLAATAVGCIAGVPPAAMQRAVETFQGLEHALERVAVIDGVQFINDSKATNIAAASRAIESFERGLVVILGGKFKGGNFGDLASRLKARAEAVIAIGESRPQIHAALDAVLPVEDAASMDDAVKKAARRARAGGVVLLAPACASFDMFRDYADRGRQFKAAVKSLEGAQSSVGPWRS